MSRANGRSRKTISYDEMEIEIAKDQFVNGETTLDQFEQFVAMRLRYPLVPEQDSEPDEPELTWHHDRRSGLLVIHFISHHGSVITISKDPKRRSLLPGATTTEHQVLDWARRAQTPKPVPGKPRVIVTSRGDTLGKPDWVLSSLPSLSRLLVHLDIALFIAVLLIALISPVLSPVLALPAVIVECILGALWVLWIT